MKFLDLFSGIGGFRLGLERNGFEPVGYVEIDKFARQSYKAMYDTKDEWTAEDITAVTDEEWRQFNGTVDLIAGGFPCQSFSIAGKRQGFLDETKGTLFFEIARAAQQIKPQYLFLENVKGLLNHDQGRTFRTIISTLDELGYDTEWRVLNSKDFGVPQNRERVYIIGHLRGASGREVFSIFGENGEANPATINDLLPTDHPRHGRRGTVLGTDGVSPTLEATDFKTPKQVLMHSGGGLYTNDSDNHFRGVMPGLSRTLKANNHDAGVFDGAKIRKLTPRECWRLQAFPDELFDKAQAAGLSDSQLYKQAGNSVTVNVIEYIGELIKGLENE